MNRTTMVRRALLAGGAALTTLALAGACGGTSGMDHGSSGQPMMSASSGAAYNDADVAFAQMMIPHHQQAVEMAILAETRASDPDIKQIAAKVRAAQAPEITTMTGWLTGWGMPTAQAGGHNMPGMSDVPGMMSDTEMVQLKAATGTDFDRMFARMMIAHHNGAIQNATEELAKGSDATAKALAATIKQTQTAEIGTLQTILDRL
jgi:uncharacterized protein (DUF305 family)